MKDKKSGFADCIFLVRHGIAEEDHPLGDEARALSAEGRADFREFCAEIAEGLGLEGIASSPLVRAVQTAEILAHACGIADVRIEAALASEDATVPGITTLAKKLGPGWALVGHNPSLSLTVGAWMGAGPGQTQFRKGAIAAFRPDGKPTPPWKPVFIASPGRKRQEF